MTKEERAFRDQFDGASIDEVELAGAAEEVPGPLGEAAKALREARERFEAELRRIGCERG